MLWGWFAQYIVPLLKNLLLELAKLLVGLFGSAWKMFKLQWGVILGLLGLLVWAIQDILGYLNNLDLATVGKPTLGMLQYYAFINRFVPLTEAFVGAVACFQVWLVVTIIRWIKSILPTISN